MATPPNASPSPSTDTGHSGLFGAFRQSHGALHHEHPLGQPPADTAPLTPEQQAAADAKTAAEQRAVNQKQAIDGLQKQIDIQIANIASAPDEPARIHEAAAQLTYLNEAMRGVEAAAARSPNPTPPPTRGSQSH